MAQFMPSLCPVYTRREVHGRREGILTESLLKQVQYLIGLKRTTFSGDSVRGPHCISLSKPVLKRHNSHMKFSLILMHRPMRYC